MIGPAALQYGLGELSKRKRVTYLQAEFPHLWPHIEKLIGGNSEYGENALCLAFGPAARKRFTGCFHQRCTFAGNRAPPLHGCTTAVLMAVELLLHETFWIC